MMNTHPKKVVKNNIPKEIRLAYLCHLLHQRLMTGRGGRITWYRHFNLVVELERERTYSDLRGIDNGKAA